MARCRADGSSLDIVLDLGLQPLGNGFLPNSAAIPEEYFYSMRCGISAESLLFQLVEQPSPELMFHDGYAFQSGTSRLMSKHFMQTAIDLKGWFLDTVDDPFVVEIGSNDGVFLQHIADAGIRHLGIEPSENVAAIAEARGVSVLRAFFSPQLAQTVADNQGRASLIYAANALCHIPDIRGVADAVDTLLADRGLFVFEDPYLGEVIRRCSYDQIYDEHVFLFSALSVSRIFEKVGLEIIDLTPLGTHGGSMRYTLARRGEYTCSDAVVEHMARERNLGLDRVETYLAFADRVAKSAESLHTLLSSLVSAGGKVVAYGATSKSTTIYNYARIGPSLISAVYDNTPGKQGTLTPGMHIPVLPETDFIECGAHYAFLSAWNHESEIRDKNRHFESTGGRWISHVPQVGILEMS